MLNPLADDQRNISISTYAYCKNNPILFIDPTGAVWDSASIALVNQTISEINDQINSINNQIARINANPEGGDSLGDAVLTDAQQEQLSILTNRVTDLNDALNEITSMGNDRLYTYTLNPGALVGEVTANLNDLSNIIIRYPSNDIGLKLHEIKHGFQLVQRRYRFARENGVVYPVGFTMNLEVEAWNRQFSYAGVLTGTQAPVHGTDNWTLNANFGKLGTSEQLNSEYRITNPSQITTSFLRRVIANSRSMGNQRLYSNIP
jgi:hypothetical protein